MSLEIINISWSQISWNDLTILKSLIKSNVINISTIISISLGRKTNFSYRINFFSLVA